MKVIRYLAGAVFLTAGCMIDSASWIPMAAAAAAAVFLLADAWRCGLLGSEEYEDCEEETDMQIERKEEAG